MNVKKYYKGLIILAVFVCIMFTFIFFFNLYPLKYKNIIKTYADEYLVQPELIASIINTESNFNKKAISNKGAVGLMQLMPSTAKWIANLEGIEYKEEYLLNENFNIMVGVYYLDYLSKKFNNIDVAIIAYNAGEGNVLKWLENSSYSNDGKSLYKIPFKESENYLKKVKNSIGIYKLRFLF